MTSECTPAGHSVSAIQLINNALLKPAHRATQDDRAASASACVREMCQAPKSSDRSLAASLSRVRGPALLIIAFINSY